MTWRDATPSSTAPTGLGHAAGVGGGRPALRQHHTHLPAPESTSASSNQRGLGGGLTSIALLELERRPPWRVCNRQSSSAQASGHPASHHQSARCSPTPSPCLNQPQLAAAVNGSITAVIHDAPFRDLCPSEGRLPPGQLCLPGPPQVPRITKAPPLDTSGVPGLQVLPACRPAIRATGQEDAVIALGQVVKLKPIVQPRKQVQIEHLPKRGTGPVVL